MRKGLGGLTILAVVVAALIGAGAVYAYTGGGQPADVADVDYDGAFAAVQPIQELTGYNDLSVTQQDLNSTGLVDDGNIVTTFNVNESNGEVLRFAFGFDVDGPMEEVDVEMTSAVDSAFDVRSARIVADENDDVSIDEAASVTEFAVDDNDEVDGTVSNLPEGDYLYVLEVRGIDTGTVSAGADMYTVDFDATTDADSDEAEELHLTIDNKS